MGTSFQLLIVTVLICSSAVSSTIPNDVEEDVEAIVLHPDQLSCSTCNLLSLIMKEKFESIKREDMAKRMLHSCYSLQVLSETCANLVADYFDDIYDLVQEQLQSNDICALSGICSEVDLKVESKELQTETKQDEFYCEECKKIVKHVHESVIKNMSEAQFKKMLMGSCTLTRSLKTECLRIVDQYYHVIYDMLKSNFDTEGVCLLIGVCDKKTDEVQLYIDEDPAMPQCLLCKTAFRIVKKLVSKHASNDQVKHAMYKACNKLGKVSQKCHDFVIKHGNGIIWFVRNPRVICSMLGMCFPFGPETIDYEIDEPQKNEDMQLLTDTLTKDLVIQEDTKGLPKCSICQTAMKALKQMIHHGGKDEIKRALGHVCQKVGKLQHACEEMVNKHSDQIVDLLTKHTPPKMICKMIGVCHTSVSHEDFEIDDTLSEQESTQLSVDVEVTFSPKCFVCKKMMSAIKHMAKHGDSGSIQRAMQKACSKMGKLSKKCDRLVQKYGNKIVGLMVKHAGAKRICHMIGVCKKGTFLEHFENEFSESQTVNAISESWEVSVIDEIVVNDQLEGSTDPQEGPLCIICELLIARFKATVDTKGKRDVILKSILHTCDQLPSFIREPCHSIVQGYGFAVLDLISRITPHEVCRALPMTANEANSNELDFLQVLDEFLNTN